MASKVLGILILATNGDRTEFLQDPYTYAPSFTESTPLGAVESFQLGSYLKSTYLDSSSPLHIRGMPLDPAHPIPPSKINVHAKSGGGGAAIFDSSVALLQGLFPPTSLNKMDLANGSTIVAPLGGYQYVPVEMNTEGGDRVLEPWTDCKAFKKHVAEVYTSEEFKQTAKNAEHFFEAVRDYMFGRPASLVDMVYDYLNTQLIHNQSFAFRLPPTLIEQARGLAAYKESAAFSDKDLGGIGNIAGRAILSPITKALERIAFDDDPLRLLLIETSYQPFISLFSMLSAKGPNGQLSGIPNYASALSFEIIRGPAPEFRDFVRLKFKNGTEDAELQTLHIFDHPEESVPVTEFIYRLEVRHTTLTRGRRFAQTYVLTAPRGLA
ncbi:histidine phosphatase superfamily [Boletus edulis BED1]|uniref:Histidine phosphatase superfamily n=1 Tax=Boletus edulis BED1 TaxID=1328754 RepID=A0AAD4BMP9_BOLED|nr:histidine phosphatase superfamily [Boletus edulis BED1]